MPDKPRVYIIVSSNALRPLGLETCEILKSREFEPVLCGSYPVAAEQARNVFRERIAACSCVLYLVGRFHGAEPAERDPHDPPRSYAQMEFGAALELGKCVLVCLLHDDAWRPDDPREDFIEARTKEERHVRHIRFLAVGETPGLELSSWFKNNCFLRALSLVAAELRAAASGEYVQDFRESFQEICGDLRWYSGDNTAASHARRSFARFGRGEGLMDNDAWPVTSSDRAQEPSSPPPLAEDKPPATPKSDDLTFTAYRPEVLRPFRWEKMLVFAHLSERPNWLDADERAPLEEVQAQAAGILGSKVEDYRHTADDARSPVPRDGEITFVPEMEGVEFNPPQRSFFWKDGVAVHGEHFEMRARPTLDGQTAYGRLTVFLGALILSEISLRVRIDSGHRPATPARPVPARDEARAYRKIFASYSHKDLEIVQSLERHVLTLGDEYLRDWVNLKSGEHWNDRLLAMIEEADVFQLFWSANAAASEYVEREWRHALKLGRSSFVRPTYWERPIPPPPEPLRKIHFHRLAAPARDLPAEEATGSSAPEPSEQPGSAIVDFQAQMPSQPVTQTLRCQRAVAQQRSSASDERGSFRVQYAQVDSPPPQSSSPERRRGLWQRLLFRLLILIVSCGAVYCLGRALTYWLFKAFSQH